MPVPSCSNRAAVDPVLGEARVEDHHGRIGVALVGLEIEGLRASQAAERRSICARGLSSETGVVGR
jgi:hypothetical protein